MVRVLVVDDEDDVVQVITSMLEKDGYETEAALSGVEALELLERRNVDLILLDLMMPDMHGFELCKRLHQNPRTSNIPVIVVTAKGDLQHIEEAYRCASVKSYIAKPFDRRTLLKTVALVIESKEEGVRRRKPIGKVKERLYEEIIRDYPEGIAVLDRENVVVDVNNAFEALTGFTRGEVLGAGNLPELLGPEDENGNRVLVSDAFRACFCDDPVSTAEFNITHKSGVKLRVVSTVFKTSSGMTVIALRNVT